jgi:hypothetical protein
MAANVTLLTLRTRARQRANVENSQFVTDAEVTSLVNAGIARLYNDICRAVPRYYSTDYTITTVAGTISYALPAAFRSAQGVYAQEATDYYRPLASISDVDRAAMRAPSGAYTIILRYTPAPPVLALDADTFDGISGYEEFVVAFVARAILTKEEADISAVQLELDEARRDVLDNVGARDQGAPVYVTEVENITSWPYPYQMAVNAYQLRAGYIDLYSLKPIFP